MNDELYAYLTIVEQWAVYQGLYGDAYELEFIHPKTDQPPLNNTISIEEKSKIIVEITIIRTKSILGFYIKDKLKTTIKRNDMNSIDVNLKFIPKSSKITQLDITQKAQDFINSLRFFNGIRSDLILNNKKSGRFVFITASDVVPANFYTERQTFTPAAECSVQLHYTASKTFTTPFTKVDEVTGKIIVHKEKV